MRNRLQGEDDLRDPAFHVVDAGPAHDVALDRERHLAKGAERPDRIVMPEQQLSGAAGTALIGTSKKTAAMSASG